MSCCHRDTYRREALKAIGELAMVLPDDAYNRLDSICAVVRGAELLHAHVVRAEGAVHGQDREAVQRRGSS